MSKKITKTYAGEIPYDRNGNMQHYPDPWWTGEWGKPSWKSCGPDWRANEPFEANMTVTEYARGRSAAYFELTRADGKTFPVFLTDFIEMLRTKTLVNGEFHGRFIASKRGQNYGLKLAK